MKTNVLATVAVLFMALNLEACHYSGDLGLSGNKRVKASDNYVTKEIRVNDFTCINLWGSPDVIYTQQPGKPRVEIYAADNIVNLLDIHVKNNKLNIGFKKGYSKILL